MLRFALALLLTLITTLSLPAQENWPRWRGPQQDGHYSGTDVPLEWNEANIVWRTELPGSGQSNPCLWGNRIFLTSNHRKGAERLVLAVDKTRGDILWTQSVWEGEPERSHALNGWASACCVTDGKHVYAFFGIGGLHCLTVEGEIIWSKDLGEFVGPWGTAASPILVRDMLIQNCDADANARLMAFDKTTGKELWSTKRENARGWSTPILITVDGREELILNGDSRVTAYDPETGEELWFCKSFNGRGAPTATFANDLIHMINGKPGDGYAIRPGGTGDVTKTHLAWHSRRPKGRDLPSPVVIGKQVVTCNMDGVYSAYDSLSGKQIWIGRVGGKHVATPVSYRGMAVFIDEAGMSTVIEPADKMKVAARNTLGQRPDEIFRSSVVPNDGHVFIRSTKALYKVGK